MICQPMQRVLVPLRPYLAIPIPFCVSVPLLMPLNLSGCLLWGQFELLYKIDMNVVEERGLKWSRVLRLPHCPTPSTTHLYDRSSGHGAAHQALLISFSCAFNGVCYWLLTRFPLALPALAPRRVQFPVRLPHCVCLFLVQFRVTQAVGLIEFLTLKDALNPQRGSRSLTWHAVDSKCD